MADCTDLRDRTTIREFSSATCYCLISRDVPLCAVVCRYVLLEASQSSPDGFGYVIMMGSSSKSLLRKRRAGDSPLQMPYITTNGFPSTKQLSINPLQHDMRSFRPLQCKPSFWAEACHSTCFPVPPVCQFVTKNLTPRSSACFRDNLLDLTHVAPSNDRPSAANESPGPLKNNILILSIDCCSDPCLSH